MMSKCVFQFAYRRGLTPKNPSRKQQQNNNRNERHFTYKTDRFRVDLNLVVFNSNHQTKHIFKQIENSKITALFNYWKTSFFEILMMRVFSKRWLPSTSSCTTIDHPWPASKVSLWPHHETQRWKHKDTKNKTRKHSCRDVEGEFLEEDQNCRPEKESRNQRCESTSCDWNTQMSQCISCSFITTRMRTLHIRIGQMQGVIHWESNHNNHSDRLGCAQIPIHDSADSNTHNNTHNSCNSHHCNDRDNEVSTSDVQNHESQDED